MFVVTRACHRPTILVLKSCVVILAVCNCVMAFLSFYLRILRTVPKKNIFVLILFCAHRKKYNFVPLFFFS